MPAAVDGLSFEQAMAALDATVRRLDSGELPLDQALAAFEEGVRLQARCQELLDQAEQRIIELSPSAEEQG
ncbi:MAG: exodeoxyribonuclease VII small subunit [Deltaproteobacteria bacterium]|jgi:exodeoxyribonuclease VII small subunit|nr:exodeoxyribonuclease VII small subunit [Deltaproteobacteria bacterium]